MGLVFLLAPDWQPEAEPDPSGVELVESDVDREANIRADVTSEGIEPDQQVSQRASVLSVTLRNTSDDPVLVTHADVRFSAAKEVGCPYGAGLTTITAQYNIKVPANRSGAFSLTRKMKYTVAPHRQERMAFSVGPERSYEGSLPWMYAFTVVLHLDNGTRLTVPEAALLAPQQRARSVLEAARSHLGGQAPNPFTKPECIRKEAAALRQFVAAAKRPSPELREFSTELGRIAQRL